MKLYDTRTAPNPRRVRIFLAEKGIDIPSVQIDLGKLEQRGPEYTAINPVQRTPALALDDGTVLTESVAICRYFEEMRPEPPLMGTDAKSKALTEMWQRRIELHFLLPVALAFRHTHPAMAQMENPQFRDFGEANKPRVLEFLQHLDGELEKRRYVAGETFTIADITALVACDFMRPARIPRPEDLKHLTRWYGEVSSRPSAKA
ncbi:MAG: glutathione S-transferase [Beijerinckiaceae bacterium]